MLLLKASSTGVWLQGLSR